MFAARNHCLGGSTDHTDFFFQGCREARMVAMQIGPGSQDADTLDSTSTGGRVDFHGMLTAVGINVQCSQTA